MNYKEQMMRDTDCKTFTELEILAQEGEKWKDAATSLMTEDETRHVSNIYTFHLCTFHWLHQT